MAEWVAKRFWEETTVAEQDGGFAVLLDGRSVRTPAKAPLVVPTQALAEMIAAEWDAQSEKIDPNTMPATRGANAALDRVCNAMSEVVTMLVDYGDADLLCYRAEYPLPLVERQNAQWNPLLDWAFETYGARLDPRVGVMHSPQETRALEALRAPVEAFNAFELSAFHDLVTLSGSLVLGLAATHDVWSAEELWSLSRLDETFQEEQWGEDEDAAREAAIKRGSFEQAHRFFHSVQK